MIKPSIRITLTFFNALILSMILVVPNAHATSLRANQGTLIKFQTDPRVYLVKDAQGSLEWIRSEAELQRRGLKMLNVSSLSDSYIELYKVLPSEIFESKASLPPTILQPLSNDLMVMVIDDGTTVINQGGHSLWSAASITKLLSAIVLDDMKLNWNGSVTMAKRDEVGGARLRAAVGSRYRRIDLQHASLMGSANNSTYTLARTSGLTVAQFVARMNVKAKELGMVDSHFVDPTGLDPLNISTAADIVKLVIAANKIPRIAEIGKKTTYTLVSTDKKQKQHTIKTTNALLKAGDPVSLGKTGYLEESRYNFTVCAVGPHGQDRTVVVLNAPSQALAYSVAKKYVYQQ